MRRIIEAAFQIELFSGLVHFFQEEEDLKVVPELGVLRHVRALLDVRELFAKH